MKKILPVDESSLVHGFVTPPECGGQVVEKSYALMSSGNILERIVDRADGKVTVISYRPASGKKAEEFQPWNYAPALGRRVAEVRLWSEVHFTNFGVTMQPWEADGAGFIRFRTDYKSLPKTKWNDAERWIDAQKQPDRQLEGRAMIALSTMWCRKISAHAVTGEGMWEPANITPPDGWELAMPAYRNVGKDPASRGEAAAQTVDAIREVKKWSAARAGNEIGVSRSTVNNWRIGRNRPTSAAQQAIFKLAAELFQ